MKRIALATVIAIAAGAAQADEIVTYATDQSYDDVIFGLENAIIEQGFTVDTVHHVSDMLERTRADVGSDVVIYETADVFSFCSATLSRKMMEANPMNIAYCPYNIFVARVTGSDETVIGYRTLPEGEMQEVQTLLDHLAKTAIGME